MTFLFNKQRNSLDWTCFCLARTIPQENHQNNNTSSTYFGTANASLIIGGIFPSPVTTP